METSAPTPRASRTYFEILFYYGVDNAPKNEYVVESYFFIPKALRVTPETYSKDDFFGDLENYVRFRTPQISLGGLVAEDNPYSPLGRVFFLLERISRGEQDVKLPDRIIYELKMLGNVVRSHLRDQVGFLARGLARSAAAPAGQGRVEGGGGVGDGSFGNRQLKDAEPNAAGSGKPLMPIKCRRDSAIAGIVRLLDEVDAFWEKFGRLESVLLVPQVPHQVRETYDVVRDFASWIVEKYLTRLLLATLDDPELENIQDRLREMCVREQTYRKARGSKLVLKGEIDAKENEGFTYWLGLYKKFVSSVLFLTMDEQDQRFKLMNVTYGLAAAVAMGASVWLSFLVQRAFPLNTLPFFTLIVVIYVLKDRIKDLLRFSSDRMLTKYFPDRHFHVLDGVTGERIGSCKESVGFVDLERVPHSIRAMRDRGARTDLEKAMKPEVVLKYKKVVTLFTEKISELHTRQRDLHDVVRFSIRRFLTFCDRPHIEKVVLDETGEHVKTVYPAKVYHLNVVQRLTARSVSEGAGARDPSKRGRTRHPVVKLQRIRVVFDKNGLKRVEEIR
ncbi:MAG: hypothetical protein Kow0069_20140 [Promethearchaeota archaeon]